MAFYSTEEFKSQMEDCLAEGMTYVQAYRTVTARERDDEADYQKWLDEQREAAFTDEEFA